MDKFKYLIGIDEVGRGPIAGPVAVGAFVFAHSKAKKIFRGVKESKQLDENKREQWFAVIQEAKRLGQINYVVNFQSNRVIDSKGIVFAINKALKNALNGLCLDAKHCRVLLDGGLRAPDDFRNQKTIIKGDEKEMVIALASICAKVLRDRYMNKISKKHKEYGFHLHKGYGTKKHYQAIRENGLTHLHRKTFIYGV